MRFVCLVIIISLRSLSTSAQVETNTRVSPGTLPVMFDSVRAIIKDEQVQIGWSNLTEREVSFYLIERSTDGSNFEPVYKQMPSSNLNEKAAYSFTDANPLDGNSYYRIRVLILTGKTVFSRILKAQTGFSTSGFTVYPNPVTEEKFNVCLAAVRRGKYTLNLLNSAGIAIQHTSINLQGDGITESFSFPAGLNPGIYVLSIKGEEYAASRVIVKK